MKTSAEDIARALIQTCRSLTEEQCAEAADAALEALRTYGLSRDVRRFPRIVRCMMEKEGTVFAECVTPSGNGASSDLSAALTSVLKKNVSLTFRDDPSLLGGAILTVRDDRFDASVRTMLQRF